MWLAGLAMFVVSVGYLLLVVVIGKFRAKTKRGHTGRKRLGRVGSKKK